jgi:hypothetical protein
VCIVSTGWQRFSSRRIALAYPLRVTPIAPWMVSSFSTTLSETKSGMGLKPFTPASTMRPPMRAKSMACTMGSVA